MLNKSQKFSGQYNRGFRGPMEEIYCERENQCIQKCSSFEPELFEKKGPHQVVISAGQARHQYPSDLKEGGREYQKPSSPCRCGERVQRQQLQDQLWIQALQTQRSKLPKKNRPVCKIAIDLDQMRSRNENKISLSPLLQSKTATKDIDSRQYVIQMKVQNQNQEYVCYPFVSKCSKMKTLSPIVSRKASKDRIMDTAVASQVVSTPRKPRQISDCLSLSPINSERQKQQLPEVVLDRLYQKLAINNLPHEKQLNYRNFDYKILSMPELHFISVLFQRIDQRYLSSMDAPTFKQKAVQTCIEELQQLVRRHTQKE